MGSKSTSQLVRDFILLILSLILLSCKQTSVTDDPLNDTGWVLESLYGNPPLDGTTITLKFTQSYTRGDSGCNDYFGKEYKASEDGSLTLPSFGITMALCSPEEIMDQEENYIQALDKVTAYRLTKGQLELLDTTGDTILVFRKWDLWWMSRP